MPLPGRPGRAPPSVTSAPGPPLSRRSTRSAPATRRRIDRFLSGPGGIGETPLGSLATLTEREREITALAAHGLSNQEIAERLVVSPLTVRTHVHRAMAKIQARDRAQLVVAAYQQGLVRVR